jgi:SRSO17 transposase
MSNQPSSALVWENSSDVRVEPPASGPLTFASLVPRDALERFLDGAGLLLGRPERRASFSLYALGLLGEGERKSAEPIAMRAAGGDSVLSQRYHDRLCHFLNSSRWDDRALRGFAARFALSELPAGEAGAWLVDDVCFAKQGQHSPGVQKQYSRAAGRVLNCQVAVGLTLVTRSQRLPIELPVGIDLFLPEAWASDEGRRSRAKIPEGVRFRTAPEIALDLLADASHEGLPLAPVVAGPAYGSDREFRDGVARSGLRSLLEVEGEIELVCPELGDAPMTAHKLARALPAHAFRRVTFAEGGEAPSASRFARVRVEPALRGQNEPREQELLIEWPEGRGAPLLYALSTLPADEPIEELVRLSRVRGRSRRPHDELRRGLGLDHFEGRTYVGWQHHVSAVLACYALVVACRGRDEAPAASERPRSPADASERAALLPGPAAPSRRPPARRR